MSKKEFVENVIIGRNAGMRLIEERGVVIIGDDILDLSIEQKDVLFVTDKIVIGKTLLGNFFPLKEALENAGIKDIRNKKVIEIKFGKKKKNMDEAVVDSIVVTKQDGTVIAVIPNLATNKEIVELRGYRVHLCKHEPEFETIRLGAGKRSKLVYRG